MTLAEYLNHVKWMLGRPLETMDQLESLAFGFLDFPEIKTMNLYDLAWVLSHPQSGYCSKGDLQGLVELIENRLK
jgi:hypothetical protein